MAGNSSCEPTSYNANSVISIKGLSSEINYKNTGEYFIYSLSCCSGKHLNHCKVYWLQGDLHICLSALWIRSIFLMRDKHAHLLCVLPLGSPVWSSCSMVTSYFELVLEPGVLLLWLSFGQERRELWWLLQQAVVLPAGFVFAGGSSLNGW